MPTQITKYFSVILKRIYLFTNFLSNFDIQIDNLLCLDSKIISRSNGLINEFTVWPIVSIKLSYTNIESGYRFNQ